MSASTGNRYGVARNPVPRCVSASRISSTSRSAVCARSSSGTRPKARARTWLAWVSGVSAPSGPMNSVRQAAEHVGRQLLEARRLGVMPEHPADARGQRGGVVQERGADRPLVAA